jgi:hypothetical protein
MNRTLIHNGPAYRVELTTAPSIDKRTAVTFETTWPTAKHPERVEKFGLFLTDAELAVMSAAVAPRLTFTHADVQRAARCMELYGGGFASALAVAMGRADAGNLERLVQAFPDLIERYSAFDKATKE